MNAVRDDEGRSWSKSFLQALRLRLRLVEFDAELLARPLAQRQFDEPAGLAA
jgi:hypothetical protein